MSLRVLPPPLEAILISPSSGSIVDSCSDGHENLAHDPTLHTTRSHQSLMNLNGCS
jgi:hypothetical protein